MSTINVESYSMKSKASFPTCLRASLFSLNSFDSVILYKDRNETTNEGSDYGADAHTPSHDGGDVDWFGIFSHGHAVNKGGKPQGAKADKIPCALVYFHLGTYMDFIFSCIAFVEIASQRYVCASGRGRERAVSGYIYDISWFDRVLIVR
jgi:hypothetical protein